MIWCFKPFQGFTVLSRAGHLSVNKPQKMFLSLHETSPVTAVNKLEIVKER